MAGAPSVTVEFGVPATVAHRKTSTVDFRPRGARIMGLYGRSLRLLMLSECSVGASTAPAVIEGPCRHSVWSMAESDDPAPSHSGRGDGYSRVNTDPGPGGGAFEKRSSDLARSLGTWAAWATSCSITMGNQEYRESAPTVERRGETPKASCSPVSNLDERAETFLTSEARQLPRATRLAS
jgi:hypothetical protein